MSTGKMIVDLRKKRGWSQTDLANESGVSREMIGRYERDDASPSIDAAKKIADAFEVSLDYLVGTADQELDKATLKRILQIAKLNPKDKQLVFEFLDAFILKTDLQQKLAQ